MKTHTPCPVNCNGGCPHCAPKEHEPECVAEFEITHDDCTCDDDLEEE